MRGYYRIPRKTPANRVEGPLAELVRDKFAAGWSKARIAREFRLNRRTVARICASVPVDQSQAPACSEFPGLAFHRNWWQKRRFPVWHQPPDAQNQDKQK